MIYGRVFDKLESDNLNEEWSVLHCIIDNGIIDESSGRLHGKGSNDKPINVMYGATDKHAKSIRIKIGVDNDFTDRSKYSELYFMYNDKEYGACNNNNKRKMPKNECEFALGFVGRYEEALKYNVDKKLKTDIMTDLINKDMDENFRMNKPDSSTPKYSVPTGKIDVVWVDGEPTFVESDENHQFILIKGSLTTLYFFIQYNIS